MTGFLRNYGRFLDLDEDDLVAELMEQGRIRDLSPPPLKTGGQTMRVSSRAGRGWQAFLLGLGTVLLLGAGAAYYFSLPPFNAFPGAEAPARPEPAADAPPAKPPATVAPVPAEDAAPATPAPGAAETGPPPAAE